MSTHELKYADVQHVLSEANLSNDNNVGFLPFVVVSQGAASNQRIGRKIFIKSLNISGKLQNAGGIVLVRIIVVRVRHNDGQTPSLTQLIKGGFGAGQILFFKDIEQSKDQWIMWDHVWRLTGGTGSNGAIFRKRFDINKKCLFNGATSGMGDIQDGVLGFYIFTDSTDTAGLSPEASIDARIRFTDA